MGTGAEVALASSLIISAVGTGMSVYSSMEQAKTQEQVAQYNYEMQRRNAEINAQMARQQADWNQQSAMAQYQAQQNNAAALNDQARAAEAQGREQARRLREEKERTLAMQRARYAKAGVTSEGSPLAVLADTARLTEMGIQDAAFQTELEARAYRRKAEAERFQSGFSLLDAGVAQMEGEAAAYGKQMAYRQADLTRMAGMAAAQGTRMGGYATLMSGGAQMASYGAEASYKYKPKSLS